MRRFALAAALIVIGFSAAGAVDDFPIAPIAAPPIHTSPGPPPISVDQTPITRSDLDRALAAIQVHFDAIEKAVDLSHEDAVRFPTLVDRSVAAAQVLLEAKIENAKEIVSGQIAKLEIQFQERTAAGSTAVAAALQAAKEAVGQQQLASASSVEKAQAQSGEALAQLRASFTQTANAQEAQLSDLKSRLDRQDGPSSQIQASVSALEATVAAMKTQLDKAEGSGSGVGAVFGWIIGAGGVLVALAALVLSTRPAIVKRTT